MRISAAIVLLFTLFTTGACFNRNSNAPVANISANPSIAPADGNTPVTVQVAIMSNFGPVPPGLKVLIVSSNPNALISETKALANNVYVATVASGEAGTQTITAVAVGDGTSDALNASAVVQFDAVLGNTGGGPSSTGGGAGTGSTTGGGSATTGGSTVTGTSSTSTGGGSTTGSGSTTTGGGSTTGSGSTTAGGSTTTGGGSTTGSGSTTTGGGSTTGAPGSFTAISTPTAISGPTGMFVGDFNDDGNQDLLVSNSTANVYIFHGTANGNFAAPITFAASGATDSVAVADFNLDGYTDFAGVATGSAGASVYMYINNKAGGFAASTYMSAMPLYGTFYGIASCYFDQGAAYPDDNYPDLAAAYLLAPLGVNDSGGMWGINNGTGGAATTGTAVGSTLIPIISYATGYDFASDGNAELVVKGSTDLTVFKDHSASSFSSYSVPANGNMMVIGDVDDDGRQDIMVSTSPLSILYYASGGTTFANTTATNITGNGLWVVTDDLNADAVLSTGTGAIVGLGTTTRGTMTPFTFTTNHPAAAAVAGDFNNDGVPDIATINADNGVISAMLVAAW